MPRGFGERQRLAVMSLAALGIEPVGLGRECRQAGAAHGPRLQAATATLQQLGRQAARLVQLAEQQVSAP
jgi:hypothetical protein